MGDVKFKIPLKKVPSDDCEINIGAVIEGDEVIEKGVPYAIHKGESVSIIPVTSMTTSIKLIKYIEAIRGPSDTEAQAFTLIHGIDKSLDELCKELADYVVEWDWTDLAGAKLDQPYHKPEVIKALHDQEVLYLVSVVQGQVQGDRKNGLGLTASASSGTGPNQQRKPSPTSVKRSPVRPT